jgi:hypothetical protein
VRDAAQVPPGHQGTMTAFWFCLAVSVVVPLGYFVSFLIRGP